ncbi:MAG: RNA-directed DNA polymerase, partial [Nitrososphaerales archaeon]
TRSSIKSVPNKPFIYRQTVFSEIINSSWNKATLPTQWKNSYVKPILKHKRNKNEIDSYRPISLISNMSKIMEKMINYRLIWFLEKNHLLNKYQFGFRKLYSTTDHLLRLKEESKLSIDNGNQTLVITLDYTRAFDLVWKDGLLIKMMSLNISGNILQWTRSFLTDRGNIISINNTHSHSYTLENGIPQGSCLSPTLFLIMMNDFPELSKFTSQALFADDGNIWRSGTNLKQITHHMQQDLHTIENWSTKWGFILNPGKTTGILFSRQHSQEPIHLSIKNKTINIESKFKFLGVTFDTKLTWKTHVEDLVKKTQQTLNLMRCFQGVHWGASNNTLLTLYKALIRSKLDYGSTLYMDACKTTLKRLDSLQYKALCIVLGAAKGTSLAALLAEVGETSLNIRRQALYTKYLLKIKSNPHNITNSIFEN